MVVGGLGGGEIVTWNEEGKDRVTCASRTLGEQSVDVNVTKDDRR